MQLSEPEEVLPDYEPGIDYDDEFEVSPQQLFKMTKVGKN